MYGINTPAMLLPRDEYPAEAFARAAEAEFDAMLARQLPNYTAAVSEYRWRYGLGPPPAWLRGVSCVADN